MNVPAKPEEIREKVREKYAALAVGALDGKPASCCGGGGTDPVTRDHYGEGERSAVPAGAVEASLGCGNPTALADLRPGMVVLDLGSGGGVDVLLSARRVGPGGLVYGLDMTDEMLALAERHRAEAGAENVRFLKGHLEAIPLPDASVDVVVSNCVINLSADKPRVLREAFRVLRPGGLFAVSDIVVRGTISPELRRSMDSWAGCVAGALEETEYRRLLGEAGFVDVEVRITRVHDTAALAEGLGCCGGAGADASGGQVANAFVRARRPATGTAPHP